MANVSTHNNLHKAHAKDSAQGKLLTLANLKVPDQEDRKQTDDEVLHTADGCDCYDDGAFITTLELVLKPPGNVEDVVKSYGGRTGEDDDERKRNGVQDTEDDGAPNAVDEDVCERCRHPAVEAQDRDLDESAGYNVVEFNRHGDLSDRSVVYSRSVCNA